MGALWTVLFIIGGIVCLGFAGFNLAYAMVPKPFGGGGGEAGALVTAAVSAIVGITLLVLSCLARLADMDPSAVCHYENGQRKPGADNIRDLCLALDMSADYLLGLSDETSRVSIRARGEATGGQS